MSLITKIKDKIQGKVPSGAKRSSQWSTVRALHLKSYPRCAACGGRDKLEVHHKRPFHLHPELELNPDNLITLCESKAHGLNCHLWLGHSGNFRGFNPMVEADAPTALGKISDNAARIKAGEGA